MELSNLDGGLEILINYSDEPTIALRGEVDFRNMDRIRNAVLSLLDRGNESINIDLRELIFMDTTGVSALVDAASAVVPRGGHVRLVTASSQLAKVLSRSGVSGLFDYDQVVVTRPIADCPVRLETRDVVEFEVPSQPQMLSYIRSRAGDFACSMPFTDDDIEDIKLAIGEAATNAMRHGRSHEWRKVRIRLERGDGSMKMCVTDRGCGFDPDSVCCPNIDEMSEGGRGIMFMNALMDDVKFTFEEPGTCVEMTKRLKLS
ncbi:MAG: ATP-binding protein [Armatimonadota bacterium]